MLMVSDRGKNNLSHLSIFHSVFVIMYVVLPSLHAIYIKILIKFWRIKRRQLSRRRPQHSNIDRRPDTFLINISKTLCCTKKTSERQDEAEQSQDQGGL